MRHRCGLLLAGVLVVAGVLPATGSGPAGAATNHRDGPIAAAFPDIEVPAGETAVDLLGPSLWSTAGPTTVNGATVTYQLSGAPGVELTASGIGGGECARPAPARIVCSDPRELSFEGETIEQYLPVAVTAAATARPGDTATVTVTFSADGLTPITGVSEVRVVDGRPILPITGATTGPAAAAGLLLLGAGVLVMLAAGRRRSLPAAAEVGSLPPQVSSGPRCECEQMTGVADVVSRAVRRRS